MNQFEIEPTDSNVAKLADVMAKVKDQTEQKYHHLIPSTVDEMIQKHGLRLFLERVAWGGHFYQEDGYCIEDGMKIVSLNNVQYIEQCLEYFYDEVKELWNTK